MTKVVKNVTYSDWYVKSGDKKPKIQIDEQYAAKGGVGSIGSMYETKEMRAKKHKAKEEPVEQIDD